MFKGNISKIGYYLILYFIHMYWKPNLHSGNFSSVTMNFSEEFNAFIETHTIIAYIVRQNLTLTLAFDILLILAIY